MTVLAMRFCHHSLPCPLQISWICSICDLPPSPSLAMTEISGRQHCQWTTTVTVKSFLTHVLHIHMYNVIVCFVHAICMFVICSVHQTHGFKFRLIRNGMDLHFNMDFKDHYQVCNWHFRSFKVIQIYTIFY